tara:strand:+ start:307 stop:525 length:219 start_codon:yes stop_codon:yes gene_type:complete
MEVVIYRKATGLSKQKKRPLNSGNHFFFKEFGENYNSEERRYIVHLIKGFWIVKGILPVGYTGGTLVPVIDS